MAHARIARTSRFHFSWAVALVLVVTACGGGRRHVAEITPQVGATLSGPWVLNEQESDDPEEAIRSTGRATPGGDVRPGAGGRAPGGQPPMGGRGGGMSGGRGGMPGGRAAPGGAGMGDRRPGGGPQNPAALLALRRIATAGPRTLQLSLTDSLVEVAPAGEEPWVLPFGDKVEREVAEDVRVEARAEWENGRLTVTRKVPGGGEVRETFMPSVDGTRLTVVVEWAPGGRGGVEFRRVYERPGDRGSGGE